MICESALQVYRHNRFTYMLCNLFISFIDLRFIGIGTYCAMKQNIKILRGVLMIIHL